MSRKARTVIASTFGLDIAGFEDDYRYQPTRTDTAVYAISDQYFAIGKDRPTDEVGGEWLEHQDQLFAKENNTTLWYCNAL